MELSTIKDAFDRVTKKQKLSCSKTQEVIDKVEREIELIVTKMQSADNGIPDQKSLLKELTTKLNEISPTEQLEGSQKELNITLSKYTKILDKNFNPDISKAYRHINFDTSIVNQIIATHFYRQGLFDLGDCFIRESVKDPADTDAASLAALKPSFLEMYRILDAMKSGNLEPALNWAMTQKQHLRQNGSTLELKLHQLQFMEMLKKGTRNEALVYAKKYLAPFASVHKVEIQKLMACLLWVGRLERSPYCSDDFMSPGPTHWERIMGELTQQFCSLLGQSYESPLSVALTAGVQGLPTLLKLATVMAATKKQEWQSMKQLPVPVDLGREFQFHSIFVCPVLREQGSEENPPMLMPCGHVISKQSIVKLSKSSSRPFKCPYCPLEANVAQCRQLHF